MWKGFLINLFAKVNSRRNLIYATINPPHIFPALFLPFTALFRPLAPYQIVCTAVRIDCVKLLVQRRQQQLSQKSGKQHAGKNFIGNKLEASTFFY